MPIWRYLKLKFKDSSHGKAKETPQALDDEVDLSQTIVQLSPSCCAIEILPPYEVDDGPLATADIKRIREAALSMMPYGKILKTRVLLSHLASACQAKKFK
jgi:hypothetical protein